MTRVAIYARYSSDLQNVKSIEDQVRICKATAEKAAAGTAVAETKAAEKAAKTYAGKKAMDVAKFGGYWVLPAFTADTTVFGISFSFKSKKIV